MTAAAVIHTRPRKKEIKPVVSVRWVFQDPTPIGRAMGSRWLRNEEESFTMGIRPLLGCIKPLDGDTIDKIEQGDY